MPKRIIDEESRAATASEKARRERESESPDDAYEEEAEPTGLDEGLANPELETEEEDDEEDFVSPPPLDGRPTRL